MDKNALLNDIAGELASEHNIIGELKQGRIVKLGRLGNFQVGCFINCSKSVYWLTKSKSIYSVFK